MRSQETRRGDLPADDNPMKPILFNDEMVRAILEGRKTQTRRLVKPQPAYPDAWETPMFNRPQLSCPFGKPGDRLWVREAWQAWHRVSIEYHEWEPISVKEATASRQPEFEWGPTCDAIEYRATSKSMGPWTPSIHMPRWASRIAIEITDVRVQRLQDISEEDAQAEGVQWNARMLPFSVYFRDLWDSVAKPGAEWRDNPWVWAISFQRVEA